jgi:signal transduction histidine kinase
MVGRSGVPVSGSVDRAVAEAEQLSLESLRESILRRIMRAACAAGLFGILVAVVSPKPFHTLGLLLGVGASAGIFLVTLLPTRGPVFATIYPWTLVLVGGGLLHLMGPRTDAFLLVAGGLFIASLVLEGRALVILGIGAGLAVLAAALTQPGPLDADQMEAWSSTAASMIAVVLPAAIAGRMLVAALERSLRQQEALARAESEERRVLADTVHALELARTQLTHAQKVELVGQMAGGIAHDMNNALTAIMGEASLLPDEVAEGREQILEAAAYAAKLTHRLMVFARRDLSQPRPLDLGATIHSILHSLRRTLPSDIEIVEDLTEERIVVVADPTQLFQVLLNLAANARDAMPHGGQLILRARRSGDRALVEVSDSGPGIAEDVLPRIFEPFFTTKGEGHGTGLGLANVQQLVEGIGGTVTAHSRPGAGATFLIDLPVSTAELPSDAAAPLLVGDRTGTILVVDDDVRVRAVAFTALERVGYRVIEASSVEGAVDALRARPSGIDLLLTDVVMSGGGGAEAIRRIRAEAPGMRVLVTSGYADDETLRRGIAVGEVPFLPKPFTAETLVTAVERVLAG